MLQSFHLSKKKNLSHAVNLPRISWAYGGVSIVEIVAGLMSTGFEVGISWAYARKSFVPCCAPVG
jgi:hypothetical protein